MSDFNYLFPDKKKHGNVALQQILSTDFPLPHETLEKWKIERV